MKKISAFIGLVLIVIFASSIWAQQNIPFSTSSLSLWTVTDDMGAVVTPVDVSACVNQSTLIESLCGASYPKAKAPDCSGKGPVSAIWGEDHLPNAACSFDKGVFIFSRTFVLPPRERVKEVDWKIIADNFFVIRVNGTPITSPNILYASTSGGTDWQTRYHITDSTVNWAEYNGSWRQNGSGRLRDGNGNIIDIRRLFKRGTNTVEVEVRNISANVCANYAYFSMCGQVELEKITSIDDNFQTINLQASLTPSEEAIHLDWGESLRDVDIILLNVQGQQLARQSLTMDSKTYLSLPASAGIYIVRMRAKGRKPTSLKIWKR